MSCVPRGTALELSLFMVAPLNTPTVTQIAIVTNYADDTKLSQTIKNPKAKGRVKCNIQSGQGKTIYNIALKFVQTLRYKITNTPQPAFT